MRFLIVIFFVFFQVLLQAQDDELYEIGREINTKRVTLLTGDKSASIFLDGKYLGDDKRKAVVQSDKSNLCVVNFSNGKNSIEFLDVNTITKEFQLKETSLPDGKRQDKAYFDSLFLSITYALKPEQNFGFNEQQELAWAVPNKTVFTSHGRDFLFDASDYLNSLDLPCDYLNYDSSKFKYDLVFRVNDILVNIQDDYGYLQMQMTVQVFNNKRDLLFAKDILTFDAEKTTIYSFKSGVKRCYEMAVNFLTNDLSFIKSIKRPSAREHKVIEKIVVENRDTVKIVPIVKKPKLNNGLSVAYFDGTARIKSSKGFFVGFVIADAGYVLTNGNLIPQGEETVYVKVKGQKTVRGKVLRRGKATNVVLLQLISKDEFSSLELASANPEKNDTIFTVAPGKAYNYDKGLYQNEIAIDRTYFHSAIITPKKNSDGTPMLNSKGQVIGIMDDSVRGNSAQKKKFFIPIKDALNDLNLKLE